jgi:hypothetical protein
MTQDVDGYPDDTDGDVLRRVVAMGSDMSKPMMIDFHVLARSEASADACLNAVSRAGYDASKHGSDKPDYWTVECTLRMVPNYDDVLKIQVDLDALVGPHGGKSDGWGTFGNAPDNQPDRSRK